MNVLGMFVKEPLAGQVKTRLAAELGNEGAADVYRAFLADLTKRFQTAGDRRVLCYAPESDSAREYFRLLGHGDYDIWQQPSVSLGKRMESFFAHAFNSGAQRVVVIGSDSPTLPGEVIEQAFRSLEDFDCVLGPTTDGGYYLIGQRQPLRPIFDEIDWSTSKVLEQTVARMAESRLKPALLPIWYDVDTLDDLKSLRGHMAALRLAGSEMNLEQTAALLQRLML